MRLVYFDIKTFSTWYHLYFVISWILFVITSLGWPMVANFMFYGVGCLLCMTMFNSVTKSLLDKGVFIVSFPPALFYPLLVVQLVAVLLNPGGCGDVHGYFVFVERLLGDNGLSVCANSAFGSGSELEVVWLALMALYFSIVIFIYNKYRKLEN